MLTVETLNYSGAATAESESFEVPTKGQPEPASFFWNAPGLPTSIECPQTVLEEIHGEVQDGFRKLSRGGVEVGGILFGRKADSQIQILTWRPIHCEHARGPAFLLSNVDKQGLSQQLEAAARDPHLQVLEPVGWFVSHTRTGLKMTSDDAEVFQRFFPEHRQVTLVLTPSKEAPTRAGFFVREIDGRLQTESTPKEFQIRGMRMAQFSEAAPAPAKPAATVAPVAPQTFAPAPVIATPPPTFDAPAFTKQSPSGAGRRVAFAAMALFTAAIALFAVPKIRAISPTTEPIQLRMQDAKGQLRIEWDRQSATVQAAESATLFVNDGGQLKPIDLDREAALSGSVTYARQSEDVAVRLVMKRSGMEPYQELARYVGPPIPNVQAEDLRASLDGKDQMVFEAQKLREELQVESKRTRQLEIAVKRLEAQLERESRRRDN